MEDDGLRFLRFIGRLTWTHEIYDASCHVMGNSVNNWLDTDDVQTVIVSKRHDGFYVAVGRGEPDELSRLKPGSNHIDHT